MNGRLVELLRRNSNRVLDDWQTELELLPPNEDFTHGDLSYEYLAELFENIVDLLNLNSDSFPNPPGLHNYMDFTFTCSPGRAACVDLHQAGQTALFRILDKNRTPGIVFTRSEIRASSRILQNALAITMRREIETCSEECAKPYCPFSPGRDSQYQFLSHKANLSNTL